LLACIDIMDATGSRDLKLWFSDGTNYPGQDDIRARQDRLAEALAAVHARLGADQRMLLEYKLFEPSFYTMDVPDWGTAYLQCLAAGSKAMVVVDTGHHAPGTNIEFIVASLIRAGRLGGFDFNSRSVLCGRRPDGRLGRPVPALPDHARGRLGRRPRPRRRGRVMLDQCHNIEPKIPGQIRSVMNVQEATAKALRVDGKRSRRPRRRATSSARTPCSWMPTPPTCDPSSPWSGRVSASTRSRWPPMPGRATRGGSSPTGSAAQQAGWGA